MRWMTRMIGLSILLVLLAPDNLMAQTYTNDSISVAEPWWSKAIEGGSLAAILGLILWYIANRALPQILTNFSENLKLQRGHFTELRVSDREAEEKRWDLVLTQMKESNAEVRHLAEIGERQCEVMREALGMFNERVSSLSGILVKGRKTEGE